MSNVEYKVEDNDIYKKFRVQNLSQTGLNQYIPVDGVEVKLLDSCNWACRFCVNEDHIGKGKNLIDTKKIMCSLIEWIDDPEEIEKPSVVYLTGGEPLLEIDTMEQIVRPITDKGLVSRMVTNGTLLNIRNVARLTDMGLTGVKVTYTTADSRRLFDLVRGSKKNDPQILLKNIERAKRAGLWVFVRIGIGKHNADEIIKIYNLMKDIGVDTIQLKPWIASGKASTNNDQLLLSPQELTEVFSDASAKLGNKILKSTAPEFTVSCYPPAREYGFTVKDCANIAKIYCEPTGQALVCNFADELLGNWYPDQGGLRSVVKKRRDIYSKISDVNGIASCPSRINWSNQQQVISPISTAWK